jgi:chromosome segregation ATPase
MNFYELFELKDTKGEHTKKKDHKHDITIADPKAALALKQARNKYSYADSDLEAFIKQVQDNEEEEEKDIEKLERETEKQEQAIAKNKETVARLKAQDEEVQAMLQQKDSELETLRRMTVDQENELSKLRSLNSDYDNWVDQIKLDLDDFKQSVRSKLDGVQVAPTPGLKKNTAPVAAPKTVDDFKSKEPEQTYTRYRY